MRTILTVMPHNDQLSRKTVKSQQKYHLFHDSFVGLISGAIGVLLNISFAALIFAGSLSPHLGLGIKMVLFSATAIRGIVALGSSLPNVIADLDPVSTAILAWSAATIVNQLPASATPRETLITVIAVIAFTSLLTGIGLLFLGLWRVGEFIRYLPYPIIGGFLASTGGLLTKGGIEVMANLTLSKAQIPLLFTNDSLWLWLPGLLFALYLLIVESFSRHYLTIPLNLVGGIGLFYLELFIGDISVQQAQVQGLLFEPIVETGWWQPLTLADLSLVNWGVMSNQLSNIAAIVVISTMSILLTASSLELISAGNLNFDRELKVAGVANILVGLGSGVVGYHTLGDSLLVEQMGGRSRLVGLTTAVVCCLASIWGTSWLGYFPKAVLGGLLMFLGASLLREWLYRSWFKLPKAEYCILLLIFLVASLVGFVSGVVVGFFAATLWFVISYSQSNQGKFAVIDYQAEVRAALCDRQIRYQNHNPIYILELKGFLFFGNANPLVQQVRQQLNSDRGKNLRFIILDFLLVTDLDSSAILSLEKIKQITQQHNVWLLFTNPEAKLVDKLDRGGFFEHTTSLLQVFSDLATGIHWCDRQIAQSATKIF